MPQYWSEDAPCAYCPGTSNTNHDETCENAGRFDQWGRLIPFVAPTSVQLTLDFEVPHYIRKRKRRK